MFRINGEWWDIIPVPFYSPKLRRSDGGKTVAVCDDIDKAIYVENSLSGAFLKKVLCHEITHAAMFSYNVDLSIEQEEIVADLIATYGDEIVDITDEIYAKIYRGLV